MELADHGKIAKRRREGDERAADEERAGLGSPPRDAQMGAEHGSVDSPGTELGDNEAVPMEALLVEGILERDATKDDEEAKRVVLAMTEEAATRDAVNNLEMPMPEGRSRRERVQESVHDWKMYFETTTAVELKRGICDQSRGRRSRRDGKDVRLEAHPRKQRRNPSQNSDRSHDVGKGDTDKLVIRASWSRTMSREGLRVNCLCLLQHRPLRC